MKANRKTIWNNDDRAQVGIGTMIVFIATILVAATAAAVLIDTSGKLQERSSSTGNEATKQVASNLIVQSVSGERRTDTSASDIDYLNITVALAPGAKSIDMEQLKIQVSNGATINAWTYNAAKGSGGQYRFQLNFERDADTSANVMNAGDLVDIQIDLLSETSSLAERTDIKITLMPEVGSSVDASFTTPETYGTAKYHLLR